jgi:hypothetical protein
MIYLSIGNWTDHGQNTGGFYKCNRFNATDANSAVTEVNMHLIVYITLTIVSMSYMLMLYNMLMLTGSEGEGGVGSLPALLPTLPRTRPSPGLCWVSR